MLTLALVLVLESITPAVAPPAVIPGDGIGSLAQALGGDRTGAEAGTQKVLAEAKRARLVDMLTANPQDVAQRVKEGFGGRSVAIGRR